MYSAEELISKCVEGRAPQDIIRSIEEELPDVNSIRMHLMKDLNRLGFGIKNKDIRAENTCIKVSVREEILKERRSDLMFICDTYSRIYPEVEVFAVAKSEET